MQAVGSVCVVEREEPALPLDQLDSAVVHVDSGLLDDRLDRGLVQSGGAVPGDALAVLVPGQVRADPDGAFESYFVVMQFLDGDAEEVAELRRVPAESDVEVLVGDAGEEGDDEVAAALDVPLERGGHLVADDEVGRYEGEPVVPRLRDDVGRDAEVPEGLVHR